MDKIDTVTAWLQAIEQGDTEALDRLTSQDFVYDHEAIDRPLDKAGFLKAVEALHEAFPDWAYQAEEIEEREKEVVSKMRATGTQKSTLDLSFLGLGAVEATGHEIEMPYEEAHWVVKEGRVTRHEVPAVPGGGLEALVDQLRDYDVQRRQGPGPDALAAAETLSALDAHVPEPEEPPQGPPDLEFQQVHTFEVVRHGHAEA